MFVTENDHFLLGTTCNHLLPPFTNLLRFQVSFSWFLVSFVVFQGSRTFFVVFHVPGRLIMVPGRFCLIPGGFLWIFKVPGWFLWLFMVLVGFHFSRLVLWFFMVPGRFISELSSEGANTPKGTRLICILAARSCHGLAMMMMMMMPICQKLKTTHHGSSHIGYIS